MNFDIDIERDRIWHPREAERELRERGYGNAWLRWIEGDHLVYLIHPQVSPRADLGWQRGSGTLLLVMGGGAFCFKRTIVVREPGSSGPRVVEAQLVAFPAGSNGPITSHSSSLTKASRISSEPPIPRKG